MDVIAAYQSVGTYRGAAELCGTTHKTVRRIVQAHQGEEPAERKGRGHNYDAVAELVGERVAKSQGRMSAKRLLPAARAAGYAGSPRNFRRLVAEAKQGWRRDHSRGRVAVRSAVHRTGNVWWPLPARWKSLGRGVHCSPVAGAKGDSS